MTQSNPNNGSAVQWIKIYSQIHIWAEGEGILIPRMVFPVGIPRPCKARPSPWPCRARILGLPWGFKVTVITEASGIKNIMPLSSVRYSVGHVNSRILLDEVAGAWSCAISNSMYICESPGELKIPSLIQWVWAGAWILHSNKIPGEDCSGLCGCHFEDQEFTEGSLWSEVTKLIQNG